MSQTQERVREEKKTCHRHWIFPRPMQDRHSWFSSFTSAIFCNVTVNVEVVDIEITIPGGNRGQDSYKPLITTCSPTNQCIVLFYVYFCPTSYLICIVDSLTLNSQPSALQLMPEHSSSNRWISSIRHIKLSCLGTLDRASALPQGPL